MMNDFSRDLFTPYPFKIKRGGLRKVFRGHTYMLSSRGKKGQAYFLCVNLRKGCMGRMKVTPEKEKLVTHPHTCVMNPRPISAAARTPAARGRRMARQPQRQQSRWRENPQPSSLQLGRGAVEGTSIASQIDSYDEVITVEEESDTDFGQPEPEAISAIREQEQVSDAALRQLQMRHIRQKMEIGELMKEKLQIEIDLLQNRTRPGRNRGANGSDAVEPSLSNNA